jgi:hypothetical protein
MAFAAAGCRVEIACPSRHPAMLTRGVAARHSLRPLSPIRSLYSAIRKSRPDLLVPTDVITATYIRKLYEAAASMSESESVFIRSLLERSLGDLKNLPVRSSRTDFLAAAQAEAIPVPPTQIIRDEPALHRWLSANSLPAVLKADETAGGDGVEIVCTHKEAVKAWHKLRAPHSLTQALRRARLEHPSHHILPWIKRRPRVVSIQPFIPGRESSISAACWKGEILGVISVEVLRASKPQGPAVLVELTHNDAMLDAARAMVRKFNLSGLCGFDFIIEHATERAYLIEMNARATQTCHLPYGVPRDLITSLVSALAEHPLPSLNEARRRGIISLFPLAWQSGITKEVLDSTFQDIPWEEPRLVEAGFAPGKQPFLEKFINLMDRTHAPETLAGESK